MGNIMNYIWIEEECSRSVPIRNVPLHRQDHGLSIDYPLIIYVYLFMVGLLMI